MAELSPEELAEQLHTWLLDEMRYRPQGRHANAELPTPEQLHTICRGKQMQDIWKFVMARVRSAETVRTVQGNLALTNRKNTDSYKVKYQGKTQYSAERAEKLEQLKRLRAEVAAERMAADQAERDMERLRTEVANTEKQYYDMKSEVQGIQRKCALLSAHSQQVDEDAVRYKEYAGSMRTKADTLTRQNSEDQLFCRAVGKDGEKTQLETSCTRSVRESCGKIATFLHNLLEGQYSADKNLIQQEKERLWQSIESNMVSFTLGQVVNSLELLTQTTTVDLRDKTSNINIAKDAEKLKFRYENGRLMDTSGASTVPSLMQTVQQLVTERQANHFEQFIETEKHRNETWRLRERLTQGMEAMEDALRDAYTGNPGAVTLAKDLFEAEVEIASTRTALSVLDNTVDRLMFEVSEARKEKEALYSKYQKIQDFKKLTDSKQNLIRVLVKQNVSARGRLELQQEEIAGYIDKSLMGHETTSVSLCHQLKDGVNKEVDMFAKLSLPFLMYTLLESGLRLAVLDLSIHRLTISLQPSAGSSLSSSSQTVNQHHMLQQLLTALEFPPYKAPECLLRSVLELQENVDELEATLASQEALVRSIEGRDDDTKTSLATTDWQQFQGLCRKVKIHDQQQIEQLVPVLQQSLSRATQSLTDCLRLKDTSRDWWEQPAQMSAEWIKVEGYNLQQWRDRWLMAVTRLRQLKMS